MGEIWSGVLGVRRSDEVRPRETVYCVRRCACGCGLTFARSWQAIYRDVVRPWRQCALVRDCIAPEGSNKTNHRQDQTALSVLVLSQVRGDERFSPSRASLLHAQLEDGAAVPHSTPPAPIYPYPAVNAYSHTSARATASSRARDCAPLRRRTCRSSPPTKRCPTTFSCSSDEATAHGPTTSMSSQMVTPHKHQASQRVNHRS